MGKTFRRVGAIEAGGTKIVCALGDASGEMEEFESFPTTTPEETWPLIREWFAQRVLPESFGVGTFGPVALGCGSDYGRILKTPKRGWEGFNWHEALCESFARSVTVATDVEAAGLGEWKLGAGRGWDLVAYYTIGTGVGGAVLSEGRPVWGLGHSELGHVPVPLPVTETAFTGVCPFHEDCLEGRASGTAIRERWGRPGPDLGADHEAWDLEAFYLAKAVRGLLATLAPQRIILGGGVIQQEGLIEKIRSRLLEDAGGYFPFLETKEDVATVVVPAKLGQHAGITGALLLPGFE